MVTTVSDIQATANKTSRTGAVAWFDGDADISGIRLRDADNSNAPFDLTGTTVSCEYSWFLVDIEESGEGTEESPLEVSVTNPVAVTDAWGSRATITVTLDNDPTTGMVTFPIAADFYPDAAPDLVYGSNERVPAALLVFAWDRSATQRTQFRVWYYMRPMDL